MKKITQIMLFTVLVGVLGQCKKGEDDPFLSIRSRKARVAGEWSLTSGTASYMNSNNNGSNQSSSSSNITYSGTSYTEVWSYTSGSFTDNGTDTEAYTLKMTFEKDGNFEMTETMGVDLYSKKGTWNFTGGIGEHKNKQQVVIHFTSEVATGGYFNNKTGNATDVTFDLKELRSKKMVLVAEDGSVDDSGLESFKMEYVLEQ